jgi:hypothetical protein
MGKKTTSRSKISSLPVFATPARSKCPKLGPNRAMSGSNRWFGWNDTASAEGGAADSSRMTRGACMIERIGQLADIAAAQNSPPHRDAAKVVAQALKQSIELASYEHN